MGEDSARSLHDQIREDLETRILSGDWPPGHRVPSELELAGVYGCSRMTVNKVMTQLAGAGLVLRRRRAGSVVLPQRSQNAVLEIHNVKDEVLAAGGWYSHDILSRDVAGGRVSVACLHRKDDAPFCLEQRVIYLDAVPGAGDEPFIDEPPGAWLLAHVPWSEAENQITAEAASGDAAAHLGIAGGTPLLVMTRRTWKNGEPVTEARFAYPGGAHRLTARFTPSQN
ncbi:GntR family transcriptional regulator [Salipiger aestuarii]|uniref:GntR family histidine utilization transcriptional repressor n=1 Tax=Salipiger aestuarii TaxID=568098 RepID=A0A327YH08_9RHOB|nr:UTRA domain-containing protein [Salipiger aestuarii]EIE51469.1 transcriptional regulator GntR family protein [Citreicella sp. 357]KAA8608911.1 GntR family transcriptional regulator [Salipiger aestuarii]KAA8613216.1 GntR family transcriptional regulator [Salipiger aestuarii]KAB2543032.1 GntR family transcriptional regulator [Salipiger aestuarii]RAK19707.1 GntR family histidine utilization transcriptional repressor [Salipiger aestuarii]